MLGRLFSIASVFSLVVCLATVGLWARSYWVCSEFTRTGWVKSIEGEIEIVYMSKFWSPATVYEHGEYGQELAPEPQKPLEFKEHPTGALMAQPTAFGFGSSAGTHFYMQDDRFYESAWQCYLLPYWLPVTAFALLPLLWVANQRRIRNKRRRTARRGTADATIEPAPPS